MLNIIGVIASFIFVGAVISLSTILEKNKFLDSEGSRKLIHIGVSNWWFFIFFIFNSLWFAIIPPIIFIILNYISYKTNLIKSMERDNSKDLGTIYFPVSLLLLTYFSFYIKNPLPGGVGILTLGYGDGFAAVIGKKFGKLKLIHNKSLIGSITMFLVSFFVVLILSVSFTDITLLPILAISLIVAFIVTIVELLTPLGLDNLTVPIISTALYYTFLGRIS